MVFSSLYGAEMEISLRGSVLIPKVLLISSLEDLNKQHIFVAICFCKTQTCTPIYSPFNKDTGISSVFSLEENYGCFHL